MKLETCLGRQLMLPRDGIIVINHGQRFEEEEARLGKTIVDIDKSPPGMGQAMRQDRLQLVRQVTREGITHLDRRRQQIDAVFEDLREVFASRTASVQSGCGIRSPTFRRPRHA